MKKLILLAAIASILMAAFLPSSAAADITVGATTWYTWWDFDKENNDANKTKFDPTFLYGPALSIKFNDDINMTFVYLYGKFDMIETNGTNTITRTDSDFALNYKISNYFKLFAGAKYMRFKMEAMDHAAIGPGAGISAVIPAGGDFFILGNISGLYIWGQEDHSQGESSSFNEYGANTSISLAYYIASASTTLSLGGRYQYIKTAYTDSTDSDITHQFYGVTLSANYSFSI